MVIVAPNLRVGVDDRQCHTLRRLDDMAALPVEGRPQCTVQRVVQRQPAVLVLLAARARVTRNYEHKGHLFVDIDVLVTRSDGVGLVHIDHTSIYRPRQVSQAA